MKCFSWMIPKPLVGEMVETETHHFPSMKLLGLQVSKEIPTFPPSTSQAVLKGDFGHLDVDWRPLSCNWYLSSDDFNPCDIPLNPGWLVGILMLGSIIPYITQPTRV